MHRSMSFCRHSRSLSLTAASVRPPWDHRARVQPRWQQTSDGLNRQRTHRHDLELADRREGAQCRGLPGHPACCVRHTLEPVQRPVRGAPLRLRHLRHQAHQLLDARWRSGFGGRGWVVRCLCAAGRALRVLPPDQPLLVWRAERRHQRFRGRDGNQPATTLDR